MSLLAGTQTYHYLKICYHHLKPDQPQVSLLAGTQAAQGGWVVEVRRLFSHKFVLLLVLHFYSNFCLFLATVCPAPSHSEILPLFINCLFSPYFQVWLDSEISPYWFSFCPGDGLPWPFHQLCNRRGFGWCWLVFWCSPHQEQTRHHLRGFFVFLDEIASPTPVSEWVS